MHFFPQLRASVSLPGMAPAPLVTPEGFTLLVVVGAPSKVAGAAGAGSKAAAANGHASPLGSPGLLVGAGTHRGRRKVLACSYALCACWCTH
jgi:hypothetical protein